MIMIWGIGNVFHGDDAAGPTVAERIAALSIPGVLSVNCETTPENYIGLAQKKTPEMLLIVDALDMGLPAGSIRRVDPKDCAGIAFSSHGIPVPLLLELLPKNISVRILGIQPADASPFSEVSPSVAEAIDRVCALIEAEETGHIPAYQENLSPR